MREWLGAHRCHVYGYLSHGFGVDRGPSVILETFSGDAAVAIRTSSCASKYPRCRGGFLVGYFTIDSVGFGLEESLWGVSVESA